jgi:hypothetical protein
LGLAYFWVGSINGVQVQIWATWLLYAMLVDLTDQIAEAMKHPFADISMEMIFKGLYHFTQEKNLAEHLILFSISLKTPNFSAFSNIEIGPNRS